MSNYQTKQLKKSERTQVGERAGWLGLVSNLVLFCGKLLIGLTAGSVSIMADAINSLSDTISSILTLVGFKMAAKPADSEHPYGHERFEYISGLIISLVITFVGLQFLMSSIEKIMHPSSVKLSSWLFIILISSIVIKIWQGFMYRKLSKKIHSETLKASGQDSFNDVYTTLAVLLSVLVEWLTHLRVDGYFGLLLALYILYSGATMILDFIGELLGSRPTDYEIKMMETKLDSYENILGYHDLLVHDYGPQKRFASVHIEVNAAWSLSKAHQVIDRIEQDFQHELGISLVCHLDPVAIEDMRYLTISHTVRSIIFQIDPRLRIHDFRVKQQQMQFDLVVPDRFEQNDQELLEVIELLISRHVGQFTLDITFDHNYLL